MSFIRSSTTCRSKRFSSRFPYQQVRPARACSLDETEPLKPNPADRRAVFQEEVGDFNRHVLTFHDIRLELSTGAGAAPDEHALERLIARDFQIHHELDGKFNRVIHGYFSRAA